MRTIDQIAQQEVYYCVSGLVHEIGSEKIDDWYHLFETTDEDEVYEHWIVSDWLAHHLERHGEVIERDFYELTIWGRVTTGQAISMDSVIVNIFNELMTVTA